VTGLYETHANDFSKGETAICNYHIVCLENVKAATVLINAQTQWH